MEEKISNPIQKLKHDIIGEIRLLREGLKIGHKRLLDTRETAAYLGISPKTVSNQLSAGTFPIKPKRWGSKPLWDRRELDSYIDSL